jgi:hypothetical protein
MKKKDLLEINRVLDVIPNGKRHSAMLGGQREGRGPLPSIESDIRPLKKVEREVIERVEKG